MTFANLTRPVGNNVPVCGSVKNNFKSVSVALVGWRDARSQRFGQVHRGASASADTPFAALGRKGTKTTAALISRHRPGGQACAMRRLVESLARSGNDNASGEGGDGTQASSVEVAPYITLPGSVGNSPPSHTSSFLARAPSKKKAPELHTWPGRISQGNLDSQVPALADGGGRGTAPIPLIQTRLYGFGSRRRLRPAPLFIRNLDLRWIVYETR